MAVELSSNCECPNCLEGIQGESDWNSSSGKTGDSASYSVSRKRSTLSPIMQRFLSQCCPNRLQNNKEDSVFLPSEEESFVGFPQRQILSETSKNTQQRDKSLRELTIQEVLRKFGDDGRFPPYSRSLGHFRDHVVVKLRRALYYSGIWVKHVQGSGLEKQFSANYFKKNPSSLHRLIPWLKRELMAVYGDYGYTIKNILDAILHHMTKFNLDSESFTHLLKPYLLEHTHHFLHEFITFVHSSYNMETYDRSAIYQCPLSTWMKNKSTVSAPVLPLPEDLSLLISQQGTNQSKNTQVQWKKTGPRPPSVLKQFPNGNYSSQNPQTSTMHQKTANKFHVWAEDELDLNGFKDVVCTTNAFLDWDNLRELSRNTERYKNDDQEKMTEGTKLLRGNFQDLQKSGTSSHIHSPSVGASQVPPRKYNLRETEVFSPGPGQQVHNHNKGIEKKKLEESSPKAFQRLPREGTLISSKSRETDHSSNCISRNVPSPTGNDKMLVSFRNKKGKCNQSSQCVEAGSHHCTRIQTRSSSSLSTSKSWSVGFRTRSICSDQGNVAMKGSHRSKHFTQKICSGCASACRMESFTPVHNGKVCLTDGRRPSCASKGNCDAQTSGGECESLTCQQTQKYQSPSEQQKKGKNLVSRAKRIRTLGPPKPKCTQTTAEFCVELGDLNDKRPMDRHSKCEASCRK
uniref:RING-type E3 ubiquitin transferase n=1 Tax=Cricetulus griseus TaxID=10029 RepID=A0A8C2LWZ0_CRIGR